MSPLVLILALCGVPQEADLPLAVRRVLDAAYPGWHFATIDRLLLEHSVPGSRPDWIRADFNGDRRQDYAVQVVRPTGGDSLQHVIIFVATRTGYEAITVDSFPNVGHTYLTPVPAGSRVADRDTNVIDATRTMRHDGLTLIMVEQAATTCEYVSRRLRCWTSAD